MEVSWTIKFLMILFAHNEVPIFSVIFHETFLLQKLQKFTPCKNKWAMTWQNQQNDCAPSEDSDAQADLSRHCS